MFEFLQLVHCCPPDYLFRHQEFCSELVGFSFMFRAQWDAGRNQVAVEEVMPQLVGDAETPTTMPTAWRHEDGPTVGRVVGQAGVNV